MLDLGMKKTGNELFVGSEQVPEVADPGFFYVLSSLPNPRCCFRGAGWGMLGWDLGIELKVSSLPWDMGIQLGSSTWMLPLRGVSSWIFFGKATNPQFGWISGIH